MMLKRNVLPGAMATLGMISQISGTPEPDMSDSKQSNLAPLAEIEARGENPAHLADGIKQIDGKGEWIGGSPNNAWGGIDYPVVELRWDRPHTINKVVLYDRPTAGEHCGAAFLTFDDGTKVQIHGIPNDGSAKTVVFEPRDTRSLKLTILDGVGEHIGLSEIEIYNDPAAAPERRTRILTDLVSHVDPTIETSRGRWFYCTPGSRPFGLVSAGAYTRNKNQSGGGYNYNSTDILGFANLRGWMISGVNIMPVTGDLNPNRGEHEWKSPFSHQTEVIEPGYHKVYLDRYRTWVDYTSTDRTAIYRFRYDQAAEAKLLLQLGGFVGNCSYVDGKAELVSPTRLEGSHGTTDRVWGGPTLARVFFVIEFDRPIKRMDGWKGPEAQLDDIQSFHNPIPDGRARKGFPLSRKYLYRNLPEEQAGVSLACDVEEGDEVKVKIGISYTSIENARRNLEGELPHWDFEQVRRDSRRIWNEWLGKIEVNGGEEDTRVKFYTDLWHVLLGRHKINDLNGDYPCYMGNEKSGEDGIEPLVIRRLPRSKDGKPLFDHYNSDAWWLTMWNLNILWGLAWPELMDDFSASLMEYARNGGKLPRGPAIGGYTYIMSGNPATSFLTSTYQKGLMKKVDPEAAFNQMKKDHMPGGMMGVDDHYVEHGWTNNAGKTLQWAFEDWALAQMAADLGKQDDAAYFTKRSTGWRNLIHPGIGLAFPRNHDGSWMHTDPLKGRGWVEANAWQGTFSVSHDIDGLAEAMGGREVLIGKLNHAFEQSIESDFVYSYSNGFVSYANQPGCSNAHVFNHVGQPALARKWVRRVSRQAYGGTDPNTGYGGHDEDQGQMGGVSALMKLGLFSLKGTSSRDPMYEITAPEFDEVTIHLDPRYYPGKTFKIKTYNNARENCGIQKARLNGDELNDVFFKHSDFEKGGLLEIWLGPEPIKVSE